MLESGDLEHLPSAELMLRGIADLGAQRVTTESLLIAIGAPRLAWLGVDIPGALPRDPESQLYARLARTYGNDAHGRYNAYIRRLIRFERALEHQVFAEKRRQTAERDLRS